MSESKYPPFRIAVPDRDTGEMREVEFAYSRLTIPLAFQWERQAIYFRAVLNQWIELLRNVTQKDSEGTAYQMKKEARYRVED